MTSFSPSSPARRTAWPAAGLALCGLLSACENLVYNTGSLQAADAVPPPPGQARIVTVNVNKYGVGQSLVQGFTCLDGQDLGKVKRLFVGTEGELVVPPGRHYFTLIADYNGRGVPYLLWLDALPDHLYEVRAEGDLRRGHGTTSSRFVDHATSEVVGGLIGGQPPAAQDPPKCTYAP